MAQQDEDILYNFLFHELLVRRDMRVKPVASAGFVHTFTPLAGAVRLEVVLPCTACTGYEWKDKYEKVLGERVNILAALGAFPCIIPTEEPIVFIERACTRHDIAVSGSIVCPVVFQLATQRRAGFVRCVD